jgi:hypothetical protein
MFPEEFKQDVALFFALTTSAEQTGDGRRNAYCSDIRLFCALTKHPYNKRRRRTRWPERDRETIRKINKIAMYRLPPEQKGGGSNPLGRTILICFQQVKPSLRDSLIFWPQRKRSNTI